MIYVGTFNAFYHILQKITFNLFITLVAPWNPLDKRYMKYTILCLALITGSIIFNGCTSKTESGNDEAIDRSTQVQLVIYGSNSCGHCIDFKAKLDSLNISYTFNDVEQNKALADEMLEVVHAANYYDYI